MAKVRFAPSPTGKLHLGSARTAVFNWLYARHTGGRFVLRIEDTDLARSQDAYTDSIIRDMKWMGMDHDEFYRQSDRFPLYREHCEKLLKAGKAYYCSCSREDVLERAKAAGITDPDAVRYDGHCRGRKAGPGEGVVVRLDLGPERYIAFKDAVKGKISVNTKELDDYVILKSDGSPTYNFAVVIDDALMGIDTVIRGEDHITNTAKQIVLYEYLGFNIPRFAHLPIVMDKDRAKLSKRKGSNNIESYRAAGILPEALLNAIARLGWSHGNDEFFTVADLVKFFDIDKLNKSNAVYDEDKMSWLNAKHIKAVDPALLEKHFEEFMEENGMEKAGRMLDRQWLTRAVGILRGRHSSLKDLYNELMEYAMASYKVEPEAQENCRALASDKALMDAYQEAREYLLAEPSLEDLPQDADERLRSIAEKHQVKLGGMMGLIRYALTGKKSSPDILSVIRLLGNEARNRLNRELF